MEKLDAFQACLLYRALKLHFDSDKYSFINSNGKLRGNTIYAKNKFFETNKHIRFYQELGKHDTPKSLLISNFIINPRAFIVDIICNQGYNNLDKWKNRQTKIHYNLRTDLAQFNVCKDLSQLDKSNCPVLIQKYIQEKITPETVCTVDKLINKLEVWQQTDNPLIKQQCKILLKYKPFVMTDKSKVREIFEMQFA